MSPDPSVPELHHEMLSLALQFEIYVLRRCPADGSLDQDFDCWREAYYAALDNPEDDDAHDQATTLLRELLAKTTPLQKAA